jgi:ABC-type cobalt transport system substrate-binding protein
MKRIFDSVKAADANRKKVIIIVLLLLLVLLFPVKKDQEVFFAGKGGNAGSLVKERLAPWWFPEAFLKRRVPLASASEDDLKALIEKATKEKDIEKLKVLEESAPDLHEVIAELELERGSSPDGNQSNSNSEGATTETVNPPSSSAGGTIEARIPAKIEGYSFVTESRSLLSWVGVFKSQKDPNIDSLELTIELIGKDEAEKEFNKLKAAYKPWLKELRVKGLLAYFAAPNPREAYLWFVSGDFFFHYKLILKGGSQGYLEELKKAAESSLL